MGREWKDISENVDQEKDFAKETGKLLACIRKFGVQCDEEESCQHG